MTGSTVGPRCERELGQDARDVWPGPVGVDRGPAGSSHSKGRMVPRPLAPLGPTPRRAHRCMGPPGGRRVPHRHMRTSSRRTADQGRPPDARSATEPGCGSARAKPRHAVVTEVFRRWPDGPVTRLPRDRPRCFASRVRGTSTARPWRPSASDGHTGCASQAPRGCSCSCAPRGTSGSKPGLSRGRETCKGGIGREAPMSSRARHAPGAPAWHAAGRDCRPFRTVKSSTWPVGSHCEPPGPSGSAVRACARRPRSPDGRRISHLARLIRAERDAGLRGTPDAESGPRPRRSRRG